MNTISNSSPQSARHSEQGFGAALTLVMFAFGTLSLALVANQAALTYADSTDRAYERVHADLDRAACADTVDLVHAKDVFAAGNIEIPEFNCTAQL